MAMGIPIANAQTQVVVAEPQGVPGMVPKSVYVLATSGASETISFSTLTPISDCPVDSNSEAIILGCPDSNGSRCNSLGGYQIGAAGSCGQIESASPPCYCQYESDGTSNSNYPCQKDEGWICSNGSIVDGELTGTGEAYTSIVLGGTYHGQSIFYLGASDGEIYPKVIEKASGNYAPTLKTPSGWPTSYSFQCRFGGTDYEDCGSVAALAVDPTGNYLYASFSTATEELCSDLVCENGTVLMGDKKVLARGSLLVIAINSDLTLEPDTAAQLPHAIWGNARGWIDKSGYEQAPSTVGPNLRTYPPCNENQTLPCPLSGPLAKYADTGAVFYSGVIGSIEKYKDGPSDPVPSNVGYWCYDSYDCELAYDFPLYDSEGFSVITAAEYGMFDVDGGDLQPVLFWNQVSGEWAEPPETDQGDATSLIPADTSNLLVACPVDELTSENPCDGSEYHLNSDDSGGFGMGPDTVEPFASQLLYTPPFQANLTESFGILTVAVGGPGYTTNLDNPNYYSSGPATAGSFYPQTVVLQYAPGSDGNLAVLPLGTTDGAIFTSCGAGSMGLYGDSNGNLLVSYGASGLVGVNLFDSAGASNLPVDNFVLSTNGAPNGCKVDTTTAGSPGSKPLGALGLISDLITIGGAVSPEPEPEPEPVRRAIGAKPGTRLPVRSSIR
ncbi:MAG: hypothetical protein P8R42_16175 [Candidatus Binatia bacterium]|nr:hypothetical protein [Candidatus Binatia bacterium]